MKYVSVNHLTRFSASSEPIIGEREQVRKVLNDMFDALGKYERDNNIQLKEIDISTSYITEDWDDEQLVKYRMQAKFERHEEPSK